MPLTLVLEIDVLPQNEQQRSLPHLIFSSRDKYVSILLPLRQNCIEAGEGFIKVCSGHKHVVRDYRRIA